MYMRAGAMPALKTLSVDADGGAEIRHKGLEDVVEWVKRECLFEAK